jgi:hypothetical protein
LNTQRKDNGRLLDEEADVRRQAMSALPISSCDDIPASEGMTEDRRPLSTAGWHANLARLIAPLLYRRPDTNRTTTMTRMSPTPPLG